MVVLCDLDIPGVIVNPLRWITYLCTWFLMCKCVYICSLPEVVGVASPLTSHVLQCKVSIHHKQVSYTDSEKASLLRDSIMCFDGMSP